MSSPLRRTTWSLIWNPCTQGCFVPHLVENFQLVVESKIFCHNLNKNPASHLNEMKSPVPNSGYKVGSKFAKRFWRQISWNVINVFSVFPCYFVGLVMVSVTIEILVSDWTRTGHCMDTWPWRNSRKNSLSQNCWKFVSKTAKCSILYIPKARSSLTYFCIYILYINYVYFVNTNKLSNKNKNKTIRTLYAFF